MMYIKKILKDCLFGILNNLNKIEKKLDRM